jgi:hypothetical protein
MTPQARKLISKFQTKTSPTPVKTNKTTNLLHEGGKKIQKIQKNLGAKG